MFEKMGPVEEALRAALGPRPAVLDLVRPEARSGRRWEVAGSRHHRRTPGADELDRLLVLGSEALSRATAAARRSAREAAVLAVSLADLARCRPAGRFDRQPGERGAMSAASRAARPAVLTGVSEWAVDEVALALRTSGPAAGAMLEEAVTLVERLPATLALLARGEISPAHARQMVTVVGPVRDDALRTDIEAHVLRLLGGKTPPQLGDCARRVVLRKDAEAAGRRLVAAVRGRGVRMHDRRDGSATLVIDLPLPTCAAIHRALEAYAEQNRVEGDERTRQQRMADALADLVLRPGEDGRPPVTVALTLVVALETMLGGSEPGLVEGAVVPAEMVRELAYALGLLPRPAAAVDDLPTGDDGPQDDEPQDDEPGADEPGADEPQDDEPGADEPGADEPQDDEPAADEPGDDGGVCDPVGDEPASGPPSDPTPRTPADAGPMAEAAARHADAVRQATAGARRAVLRGTWTDGELRGLLDVGALLDVRALGGTALAERPRVAVTDMLRGSLVALTDATGLRRGAALGPPAGTDAHDPGAALGRFVRLRDRRCRFPGCRARARTCDLDHCRRWPDGPTTARNLCCLCEHHHRLKHQAPGWRFDVGDDGALLVTSPDGGTRASPPPRFGTDLDLPPF
ncbi:DUF222 domain-containing protein [Geodermatophilus sp. SYSU D01106]